jgi:hypothetical protein
LSFFSVFQLFSKKNFQRMRRGRGRRRNEENDEDEKQSSCFLRFDGLEGDVWSGSLKGCFSIRSFQYGQGRGVGGRGRGGKREVSEPSVSECTIMMNYSSRVNLLHGLCTAGAVFPTAQVFIRPEDGEGLNSVFGFFSSNCLYSTKVATTITMKDVIISGFSTSVGGSGVMDVSVSLNYTDLSFDCTSVRRKPIVIPKVPILFVSVCVIEHMLKKGSRDGWG